MFRLFHYLFFPRLVVTFFLDSNADLRCGLLFKDAVNRHPTGGRNPELHVCFQCTFRMLFAGMQVSILWENVEMKVLNHRFRLSVMFDPSKTIWININIQNENPPTTAAQVRGRGKPHSCTCATPTGISALAPPGKQGEIIRNKRLNWISLLAANSTN